MSKIDGYSELSPRIGVSVFKHSNLKKEMAIEVLFLG